MKALRDIHRFLAGHGVGHQQGLMRLERRFHPFQVGHQLGVDLQTTGGINHCNITAPLLRFGDPGLGNGNRVGSRAVVRGRIDRNAELLGENGELIDSGRTKGICRNQVRGTLAFEGQIAGEFPRGRRFSGTVQANEQNDDRGPGRQIQLGLLSTQERDQFGIDDFNELLAGRQAGEHVLTKGLRPNPFDQVFDHAKIDICL